MGCGASKGSKTVEPISKESDKGMLPADVDPEDEGIKRNNQTLNGEDDEEGSWDIKNEDPKKRFDKALQKKKNNGNTTGDNKEEASLTPVTLEDLNKLTASNGLLMLNKADLEKKIKEYEKKGLKKTEKQLLIRPRLQEEGSQGQSGVFYGGIAKDVKSGEGLFVWDDGYVVEGVWKNNMLQGSAKIFYTKSELPLVTDQTMVATILFAFSGTMKDNKLEGTGTMLM